MKRLIILALAATIGISSCATLGQLIAEPTSLETITALKEVLNSSSFRAIKTLKKMQKNGIVGALPDEVGGVLNALKGLGLGKEIEGVTNTITKASGIVAEESAAIVGDAIKEVKFGDAVAVVVGGEDAATAVLRKAMYGAVKKRYSERLDQELNKADVNQYWPLAAGAYNVFAKEKVDANLSDFLAERAVDALFLTMGKEEKQIRTDPASLGKQVVTKVFDYYVNKKRRQS
ncbi:MAG: DUF4197 domain-containing protein [Bacteroidota bacterium]